LEILDEEKFEGRKKLEIHRKIIIDFFTRIFLHGAKKHRFTRFLRKFYENKNLRDREI
jgi:hypothetical protein